MAKNTIGIPRHDAILQAAWGKVRIAAGKGSCSNHADA